MRKEEGRGRKSDATDDGAVVASPRDESPQVDGGGGGDDDNRRWR